jgi:hypothetical protein
MQMYIYNNNRGDEDRRLQTNIKVEHMYRAPGPRADTVCDGAVMHQGEVKLTNATTGNGLNSPTKRSSLHGADWVRSWGPSATPDSPRIVQGLPNRRNLIEGREIWRRQLRPGAPR